MNLNQAQPTPIQALPQPALPCPSPIKQHTLPRPLTPTTLPADTEYPPRIPTDTARKYSHGYCHASPPSGPPKQNKCRVLTSLTSRGRKASRASRDAENVRTHSAHNPDTDDAPPASGPRTGTQHTRIVTSAPLTRKQLLPNLITSQNSSLSLSFSVHS